MKGKEKQEAKRIELNGTKRKTKSISNLKPISRFSLFYTFYPRNTLPLICILSPTNHDPPNNLNYSQSHMKQKEHPPHFKPHCPQCGGHIQIKETERQRNKQINRTHARQAIPKRKMTMH
ncbi:hypothetical protein M9H77_29403 [Catharanthus roseus]|uniref:Uncharacterized protein n=1 Tax=Catharanthus roseus TaxID=4058 RepID=A0ACB9ZY64_CATRO|nr:hypothetical protein M9H77_29403 [Catharanthus roseus]